MIRWSLVAEIFSLFLLAVLFLRYYGYERKVAYSRVRKLYLVCLLTSAAYILLNILCVFTIDRADLVPRWINVGLNSLYFLLSVWMCSCYAVLLVALLLEHVYGKKHMRRMLVLVGVLTLLYTAVVAVNLFTGVLFYFDGDGLYRRGPMNALGYGILAVELCLVSVCCLRHRSSVGRSVIHLMCSLPPLLVLVVIFQLIYPEILLNGTLCAITSLLLFLTFASYTSDRDSMTGLRNRKNFLTELSLRIAGRQPFYVLLVSLSGFSDVNVRYGYLTGDALLYEAGAFLDQLDPRGRAFRISNLTFAVTLPWQGWDQADACRDAVAERFTRPWSLGERQIPLSVVMADLCCTCQDPLDQVMEQLEYTLGQARRQGGFHRFDEEMRQSLWQKHSLIELMRRSIQERRFSVWYQPLFDCKSGDFHSAEALLRLQDANGNPVSPGTFIPLAEEVGLIDELTWIALEEICRLLQSGRVPGLGSVSLNLSMQQLMDSTLPDRMAGYVSDYGLRPEQIRVEITERFLLHDAKFARRQLESLGEKGFQIYMDDFGTGYSNLSSVLTFPFTCIKFDRSLLRNVPEDPQAAQMFRTLTELFHSMGKTVVAEGVERSDQAAAVRAAGADQIQGFYYAVPMPEGALTEFFLRQPPASPRS